MELEQEEELNAMMSKQRHSGHIEHKNMAETSSSSSTSLQMTSFSDQADSINEKPNGTTIVAMDNASKETNKAEIGNLVIGYQKLTETITLPITISNWHNSIVNVIGNVVSSVTELRKK